MSVSYYIAIAELGFDKTSYTTEEGDILVS